MMKKTILLCSLVGLVSGFSFSQVGINTDKPQGPFHFDGRSNEYTVPPTAATVANDVVVDGNGNVGIGTTTPQAKLDIRASGGLGLRVDDGAPDKKGKIAISDDYGNLSWEVRPAPEQVNGKIILISTPTSATSTTAPNLRDTNPIVVGTKPAVRISDPSEPMILTEGTWLIQLKYTTRTTRGSGNGTGNFEKECGNGFSFYIWTLLYDEIEKEILTTVGASQEKKGYCISTPQLNHVVKVDAGKVKSIAAYASTSTPNNVIVYVDVDILPGFSYGKPFFTAVRLDSFH
jgi:hypothetical protein